MVQMIDNEIEKYLSLKNHVLNANVRMIIESNRQKAIQEQDEKRANYYWCLNTIFDIQSQYLSAINYLRTNNHKNAWLLFDRADIDISILEENYDIYLENDKYHIVFIKSIIPKYQKLFPYNLFLSRESIIKKETCSICGKIVSLRNSCEHKIGKLYMGELCTHEVKDFELKSISIVKDPFDKYTLIEVRDAEYNYDELDMLMSYLKTPYDNFDVIEEKRKRPEYIGIKRNDLCPCGSGRKYKKCHLDSPNEFYKHNKININRHIYSENS